MSLQDYLAKNYGSVSEKRGKKKKRSKHEKQADLTRYGTSVIIDDDDGSTFSTGRLRHASASAEATKEEGHAKPRFKSVDGSWHTVRESTTSVIDDALGVGSDGPGGHEDDERPAIAGGAELLQEYAAKKQRELEEREKEKERLRGEARQRQTETEARSRRRAGTPGISKERESRSPSPDGENYGLQTADVIKKDADRARERRMRRLRETADSESGSNAETVYRDAKTGRIIDVDEVRKAQEGKRQQQERLRQMQSEWNKGLVQQREKIEEQRLVESIRNSTGDGFTVYADNEIIDAGKRAKQHWDDPALKFLQNTKAAKPKYPEYKGNAPPNRFSIRPGYRWDGVDRSNGFEVDFFKREAGSSARRAEEYAYAVADW